MAEVTLADEFGKGISQVIQDYNCRHNLEIGSWDGQGSTTCILDGMLKINATKDDASLDCIEINRERFIDLSVLISKFPFVTAYNMSSINKESFLPKSFDEVWLSEFNNLERGVGNYQRELVIQWYEQDTEKLNSIGFLNSTHRRKMYDAVLIDGSEFMGYSEFTLLKDSARCFMLDDVFSAYKCSQAYNELLNSKDWKLYKEGRSVRNGFAIFTKV